MYCFEYVKANTDAGVVTIDKAWMFAALHSIKRRVHGGSSTSLKTLKKELYMVIHQNQTKVQH